MFKYTAYNMATGELVNNISLSSLIPYAQFQAKQNTPYGAWVICNEECWHNRENEKIVLSYGIWMPLLFCSKMRNFSARNQYHLYSCVVKAIDSIWSDRIVKDWTKEPESDIYENCIYLMAELYSSIR